MAVRRSSVSSAPISRDWLGPATPWFAGGLGLMFIAYSAVATIFILADEDLYPVLGNSTTIGAFPDRYWISAFVALILFLGQVFTRKRYTRIYLMFLVPDIVYTARQTSVAVAAHLAADYPTLDPVLAFLIAWSIAAIVGFFVARWGEELLFGKP